MPFQREQTLQTVNKYRAVLGGAWPPRQGCYYPSGLSTGVATSGLACLDVGFPCLEERERTGAVPEDICQDGHWGLFGEAEGLGLLQPGEVEAQGTMVVECTCLKGGFKMMELSLVVGREGNLHKVQLGRFRLDVLRKKCDSKGSLVVQEVTQGEPR